MPGKVIRYLLIIFGVAVLWTATSSAAMDYVWSRARGDKWWQADSRMKGNLTGIAHLEYIKKFVSPAEHIITPAPACPTRNVALYLCGDSYAWDMKQQEFAGIASYKFINRYQGGHYHLDTTKRNILLLETGERLIREYFADTHMINDLNDSTKAVTAALRSSLPPMVYASFTLPKLTEYNSRQINNHIEQMLFNYNFILPVFRTKGAMNYSIFSRASGDVVVSRNRDYLFFEGSVATNGNGAYVPLTDEQVKLVVNNMNTIYDHYRKEGFTEIYLSMIPSTPAIIEPDGYNRLIPRIQDDPTLKMKVIDIYSVFSKMDKDYFSHGDTHWSMTGEQTWLKMINDMLINNQHS